MRIIGKGGGEWAYFGEWWAEQIGFRARNAALSHDGL